MGILSYVRGVIRKLINFNTIRQAEKIDTPLSKSMIDALEAWQRLYLNRASWLDDVTKSLNLPALISSELARQITLEMRVTFTGKNEDGKTATEDGEPLKNERSEFLAAEFEKLMNVLRRKLEIGCAAGGMIIKPYVSEGHLYFDFTPNWELYPVAFDDAGGLAKVIIPDYFADGKHYYTRLEKHFTEGNGVRIINTAYKSDSADTLGRQISLTEVPQWAGLNQEVLIPETHGQLFGWFNAAIANSVDPSCPMSCSVFGKAVDVIREADCQYSRILWEFEGSELAVDVMEEAVLPDLHGKPKTATRNERLFRKMNVQKGNGDDLYSVFSPPIRDEQLLNGLNSILQRVEDLCGLSRGSLSDANEAAKTATELKIMKQRSYATVADNQKALERCLKDVVRVMNLYCDIYGLAPAGDYEVSFEWDDSILVDSEKQMAEMLSLMTQGVITKAELRQWYFGETEAQAKAAIKAVQEEQSIDYDEMTPGRGI